MLFLIEHMHIVTQCPLYKGRIQELVLFLIHWQRITPYGIQSLICCGYAFKVLYIYTYRSRLLVLYSVSKLNKSVLCLFRLNHDFVSWIKTQNLSWRRFDKAVWIWKRSSQRLGFVGNKWQRYIWIESRIKLYNSYFT